MRINPVSRRVWRIGYRPEPWEWADWRWAGGSGRFNGRWDAIDGGLYRTVYAGDSVRSCLIELLAHFRPDLALVSEIDAIEVDESDEILHPTVEPGFVDIDNWLALRAASSAHLDGHFCDVTASETIAALWYRFHSTATSMYGLHDFDAAALKDARPRELTQSVSQYLWNMRTDEGIDVCDGAEFRSRHGDDLVLWAIFEREGDPQVSPKLSSFERGELHRNEFAYFGYWVSRWYRRKTLQHPELDGLRQLRIADKSKSSMEIVA
ncbi:MAG: RES family NAD+ phosphorylase [Gulosibacter sp.]|uniref:RES family NAD+ phosphorylase n=1 Tax=Gulosibacter sp. TaxID=2817531 RepID=UPI003F9130A8